MQKNVRMYGSRRVLGILCTLVLLVCALYVPMAMNVSAIVSVPTTEDTAFVFDFEDTVTREATSKEEALGPNGIGYFGWSGPAGTDKVDPSNKVLLIEKAKDSQKYWASAGGYRLHTKLEDGTYGFYSLKAAKRYIVSFKIRISSAPLATHANSQPTYNAEVYLGWGCTFNPNLSGMEGNYVNGMSTKKILVADSLIDTDSYNLYGRDGSKTNYSCSNDWRTVVYTFTTPESLTGDTALAFWTRTFPNFCCEIDDLSVIELGDNSGAVILEDEYSSKFDVQIGAIGTAVELPDISDRVQQADHSFDSWCKDADRTQSAEGVTYAQDVQTIYSKWRAPVTITFNDSLNGTSQTISGIGGETFNYPADPVDPEKKSWFMGWYTDTNFTEEHVSGKFGYSNITLHAYWKAEVPGIKQDFENYTKDQWTELIKPFNGYTAKYKSNYLIFAPTMSKQSEVTSGTDSKYAIKFTWDPNMKKDTSKKDGVNIDNVNAYDASRYAGSDNVIYLGTGLEDNQMYVLSFKYKVEKLGSTVRFDLTSATGTNSWGDAVRYKGTPELELEVSDEWQEYTCQFTTSFKNADAQHMYLSISMYQNSEVVMYFDDVEINAYAQPYESIITMEPCQGDAASYIKGVRGDALTLPTPTHPDGAPFLGWYADKEYTTRFESNVFPRRNTSVFAKWGTAPITFRSYPYASIMSNKQQYDPKFVIENVPGIGYNDDYVMHYTHSRPDESAALGSSASHVFLIHDNLQNGELYHVSFYYKGTSATNVDTNISAVTGANNIWITAMRTVLGASTVTVPKGGTDWKKADFYFTPNVVTNPADKAVSKFLYLWVATVNNDVGQKVDVFIDNVLVEKVEAPYVYFDWANNKNFYISRGEPGDAIEYPVNPTNFGKVFNGWYADRECTTKFDLKTFEADTEVVVYAGWKAATTVTYSFEDYVLPSSQPHLVLLDGKIVQGVAKTGKQSMLFGNRTPGNFNDTRSFFGIRQGAEPCRIEYGRQYVITINYLIKKHKAGNMNLSFYASYDNNFWVGATHKGLVSGTVAISNSVAKANLGKWASKTIVIDTSKLEDVAGHPQDALYMALSGGEGWEIYFDDITITTVPKGKLAVAVDNEDCKSIPSYFIGNKGASYASKLPTAPEKKDMRFKGYFTKAADGSYQELTKENKVFSEKVQIIYARFIDLVVYEDFDKGYVNTALDNVRGYTIYDFDYEIYDSEAEGNSKENVTNGRYALHRKGDSMFFENAVILTLGNQISDGERYTVSFKVKLGDYKQTDGAIKIASGRSFRYAWSTTGDYYPVVPIADLLDGQWHEVSYTFNSVEAFLSVQTPGYVELYMDEFKFTLEDKNTPVSVPAKYTEYVPAERDADGNLLKTDKGVIDVTSIIDISLYANNGIWLWIIIGVAAVLVIGGGVFAFILIKKKKQNKA